jgi:dihydroneopterin aldolase
MDKIIMKGMGFYGFHGVLEEERSIGQKFFIDVEMAIDLLEAGRSDLVEDTVSYAEVYDDIKYFAESARYNLIESLGENIAEMILAKYPMVTDVLVCVKKPEAPVRGIFEYFGVEIQRSREDV